MRMIQWFGKKSGKNWGIQENFVICHVGRIAHQKNPKGVIDIFSSCLEEEKDCVLLYVGTGELEQEIKNYAAQKRVADKVKFLGVRKDVERLMQAADCFLLPSFYEGLPIVAVEAQAAGLHVFSQIKSVRRQTFQTLWNF